MALENLRRAFRKAGAEDVLDNIATLRVDPFTRQQQRRAARNKPDPLSTTAGLSDVARNFFLPNLAQQAVPQQNQAVQGLASRAARSGLLDSPFYLSAESGLRGQLNQRLVQEAFNRALQLGQMRESIRAGGANILAQQPVNSLNDILQAGRDAFGTFATFRSLQQGGQQRAPFQLGIPQPNFMPAGIQSGFQIPNAQQYIPGFGGR